MAIVIGIDPGEHTGLAVWDTSTRTFRAVETLPLWRALEEVKRWQYACTMHPKQPRFQVVFEDARQRRWFPKERNASEYRGRLMGAGSVKRDSAVWEEFLEGNRIDHVAHKPTAGATKWTAETFARVTGYKGRTSEHSRDAAILVYGMTSKTLY